jgi:pimeloyl-ACP methyl ester carboxylesterase
MSAHVLSRRLFAGTLAGTILAMVSRSTVAAPQEAGMDQATVDRNKVTSKDGTRIAFDKAGKGPALIVVGGALSDRSGGAPLAKVLGSHFTVYSYDRRGRGDSTDKPPYAVAREIEDLEALIAEAGGTAFVHGQSSGAVLALEAAKALPGKITKLSLYEPPFIIDDSRPLPPENYDSQISQLVGGNRRGEAVEYFLTKVVGMPAPAVAGMRKSPMWAASEKLAHTLPYDIMVLDGGMEGKPLKREQWQGATMAILVLSGGASPEWIRNSARALAGVLPNAQQKTLEGQAHNAAPDVLGPELERFFS